MFPKSSAETQNAVILGTGFRAFHEQSRQDASFGGWAKKEKPPPPPCETAEYEGLMQTEIFTAPPWEGPMTPSQ